MNNFDDLFESNKGKEEGRKKEPYNKDDWAAKKKKERSEAFEMLDEATGEMMTDEEKFKDYLNVQSRFDRYSVSNAILIAYQKPDATRLADFDKWKEDGISVLKGEKAITILEPGQEYTREDGSTGFMLNVKKVFDISQTSEADSINVPRIPDNRTAIKALLSASPCDVRASDDLTGQMKAVYIDSDNAIYVRKGLEADELFSALSQTVISAKLGKDVPPGSFVSYCASYILCERNGFQTDNYDFANVPKYFEGDKPKDFRSSLGCVREVANEISQDMNRFMEEQEKNRRSKDNGAR